MPLYFCIICQAMINMDRCIDPYNFKCEKCLKLIKGNEHEKIKKDNNNIRRK